MFWRRSIICKERVFGISDDLIRMYNYNREYAYQKKDDEKYRVELLGSNLVEEDKKTEWLSFVEYYYDKYGDSNLMNLVLNILNSLKKRISYEIIYNSLNTNKEEFYEKEMAIVLDIVSYFNNSGKFLKEYINNRLNNNLNLTLQK